MKDDRLIRIIPLIIPPASLTARSECFLIITCAYITSICGFLSTLQVLIKAQSRRARQVGIHVEYRYHHSFILQTGELAELATGSQLCGQNCICSAHTKFPARLLPLQHGQSKAKCSVPSTPSCRDLWAWAGSPKPPFF